MDWIGGWRLVDWIEWRRDRGWVFMAGIGSWIGMGSCGLGWCRGKGKQVFLVVDWIAWGLVFESSVVALVRLVCLVGITFLCCILALFFLGLSRLGSFCLVLVMVGVR